VILDDAPAGRLWAFGEPASVIRADTPQDIAGAFRAIGAARAAGHFVAGYFSYELGYALEPKLRPLLPRERAVPLLWFGVFEKPDIFEDEEAAFALGAWSRDRAYAGPLQHEWDADAYCVRFDRVRALIAAGDFYQANLTFRSRFAFAGDPLALYRNLRTQSAARYGACIDDGERSILSLSPELFFDLAADGKITAKPMKGTTARGADPVCDVLVREELAGSTKNRAENLMIVDLLRNDLGRICEVGSVQVRDLFAVETYPTLHQMVSTVTAKLKPGTDIEPLVRALFPCGSITGAPKIHAMELIAKLEQSPRGVYCGAVGHFAPDGSARFNVAIRTLTISGNRGELGIGGAVVQDSEAESEYAEALLKARYYTIARRPLELIETLRWSPDEGFVRLGLHLARMKRSAEFFSITFVEQRFLDALHHALPPHKGAVIGDLRIRLTLNESGEFSCNSAPLGEAKAAWTYAISPHRVSGTDVLAQHKTNWRDLYDGEHAPGCDEILYLNERGEVAEGGRTNVFAARDGCMLTPPLSSGALDGVLRRALLDEGRCMEANLMPEDLRDGEVYLGNSLRGLIKARSIRT
jgi:para-aminobenzoate synthetase/4-amino-4-deoxychorismate lyase